MIAVDLVARWLHIIPAITLVGGTIFMRFAYSPALATLGDEERNDLQAAVRRRWAKLVAVCALFLLLSGFYNTAMASMKYEMLGPFGGLYNSVFVGTKLIGALAVFYIASLLSGRSEAAEKFRKKEARWLNVNVLLALLIVCVGGVMRVTDREPKDDEEKKEETTQVAPLEPGERS